MHTSTITSKGQTTLPVDVQRQLNVKPGDKLQYFFESDGKVTLLPKSASIKDLRGILPKPDKTVSIEEMDEAIGAAAAERMDRCLD